MLPEVGNPLRERFRLSILGRVRGPSPDEDRAGRSGRRLGSRMASALACALAGFAAVTAASAGGFSEPYKALVMTTGDNSELTDHLDIANTEGAGATAVMSLRLSNVSAGDRIRVSSEFQVTTDCLNAAGRCSNYEDGV